MRGGAERCFFELSELLRNHGHEVAAFSMHDERNLPSPYSEHFISHIDFPTELAKGKLSSYGKVASRVLYSREASKKIETLIEEFQPDIAHIHGIAHETSPSILPVLKQHGIPVVQTLHDYKLLCPNTGFTANGDVCERCKNGKYYNAVLQRCKRGSFGGSLLASVEAYVHSWLKIYEKNVDCFICPSRFLQNKLSEFGLDVTSVNIPNFVDVESFTPRYEPDNYMLFCGRLTGLKGIQTLIDAYQQLPETVRGSCELRIAGSGELEAELRQQTVDLGLETITFLGHQDAKSLQGLMSSAQFVVVPSIGYENYSMTVLEAFASGTPVIGSRIGGIPEQVIDGVTGLLFEPGDASDLQQCMASLLSEPTRAVEMGKNARQRVEEINDAEAHYLATMNVYQRYTEQKIKA